MPIYEYTCGKCKGAFSKLQKVGASEKDTVCPACGSTDVKKKISAFSCACGDSGGVSYSAPSAGFRGG